MADVSDMDLLREYVRQGAEEAFAEVVRRHVGLVYSAALRHVGVAAHAEEITQAVFVILARKGAGLRPDTVLEAWLYQTTRLVSLRFLRGERRRHMREQEAYMQANLQEPGHPAIWSQLAPLLDEAMARLGKEDREALVLRFFKEKRMSEIAVALKISEAAAQSRVHRAVEKLQRFFLQRGIDSTAAAITGAISANSIQAAPVALAKMATAMALAKGATASTANLTLIKGALKVMAWTKVKTAIVVGVIILAATGTTTVVVKEIRSHTLAESAWQMTVETLIHDPQVIALRPGRGGQSGSMSTSDRMLVRNSPLGAVFYYAYGRSNIYFDAHASYHVVLPPGVPDRNFDLLLTLPNQAQEALRAELKKQLGLVAHFETRETEVMRLTSSSQAGNRLTPRSEGNSGIRVGSGRFAFTNEPIHIIADQLEGYFALPVADETGLTDLYTGSMNWKPQSNEAAEQKEIQNAIADQLGLELMPSRESVEMLVVEKAR